MALLDNLVSHWRLNESSGNRADAHGTNTLIPAIGVGNGTGLLGTCANFDVTAGKIALTLASNTSVQTGDIDFTAALWVNALTFDSTGSTEVSWILSKRDGTKHEFQLQWRGTAGGGPAAPRFRWGVFNESASQSQVDANNLGTPATGTWYFIIVWHDSVNDVIGIQVNNGTANTAAHSTGVAASNSPVYFSGRPGSVAADDHWDGRMESASLWKRILTTAEKTTLYNAGASLAYPWGLPERSYPRGVNRGIMRGVA